jgi:hypothetical protein
MTDQAPRASRNERRPQNENSNAITVARKRAAQARENRTGGGPGFTDLRIDFHQCKVCSESPGGLTGRAKSAGSAVSMAANRAISCSRMRRTTLRRAIVGDLATCSSPPSPIVTIRRSRSAVEIVMGRLSRLSGPLARQGIGRPVRSSCISDHPAGIPGDVALTRQPARSTDEPVLTWATSDSWRSAPPPPDISLISGARLVRRRCRV